VQSPATHELSLVEQVSDLRVLAWMYCNRASAVRYVAPIVDVRRRQKCCKRTELTDIPVRKPRRSIKRPSTPQRSSTKRRIAPAASPGAPWSRNTRRTRTATGSRKADTGWGASLWATTRSCDSGLPLALRGGAMRTKTALAILVGSAGAALVARILATDRTLALLSEGYSFIPERCRRLGTDVFETRIMLTKVVCMTGEEATRMRLRVVAHT
jgi:hypothetical protein